MKIIVLSKTDYKEKDVIINAISNEKEISFLVRGLLNPTNPFVWLNNPLTVADVEFVDNKDYKYPVLKRAELISSPLIKNQNYYKMMTVGVITDALTKIMLENERFQMYDLTINFLENLDKENPDYLLMTMIYISKLLKFAGIELEVNSCVCCGNKKDIVAFSFSDGGFICKNCLDSSTKTDLNSSQMKAIRFIFNAPNFAYSLNFEIKIEDKQYLLQKFYEFINESIGVSLDSIKLLVS